ncbi:MAG: THUMP domain-containing class I SAM-dependent RNA methyltransferase [Pseudobdellovibrionaceae bacterium]
MIESDLKTSSFSFYISCALGFEEILMGEIRRCWPQLIQINGQANLSPLPEMSVERGGILIKTSFELGLQLNFFLKTAHRVLWRIAEFKVRDFPKLFEKLQKIPWVQYLKGPQVEWVVAASKSRLNNEKRIAETCLEAFAKVAGKIQGSSQFSQRVYVRIHDDLCTLSLDSSGENLYKRGWGIQKGEAPLRETLAAFLIQEMMGEAPPSKTQQVTLVDPLCGSGTIILEGASIWQPNFEREFSFLEWKNAPKIFKSPFLKQNYKQLPQQAPFKSYLGYDIENNVLQAAEENRKSLETKTQIKNLKIRFENENLFAGEKKSLGPVWCITNPPYGERLHVQGRGQINEAFSYQELVQRMADKFSAEKIGVLLPNKSIVRNLRAPEGYKKKAEIPLSNGGLDVVYLIFAK